MSTVAWLPIKYRDFYDIPRAFSVEFRGALYFFDCPFDERADDYPNAYTVYRLPPHAAAQIDGRSWDGLASLGTVIGKVSTHSVALDPSKRRFLDDRVFAQLLL